MPERYNARRGADISTQDFLGLPSQTAESLARLDHYQVLGLSEASSTKDVLRALQRDRWPWHLVDEDARQMASRMKAAAHIALATPKARAEYDREQGFTVGHLAAEIGDDSSRWATVWVASWAIVAVLLFLEGPYLPARVIGTLLAPGYDEVAVYHPALDCSNCGGTYTREFLSSSSFFHWLLNSLFIWALLPMML